jgi:hypothetical protein
MASRADRLDKISDAFQLSVCEDASRGLKSVYCTVYCNMNAQSAFRLKGFFVVLKRIK